MTDKYYWLKLQRDFFKRHDVRIVEAMPNGKDYVLFYLKLLCESIDHEGRLRFSDSIPYNDEMLATITNTNIDIVRSAVKIFTELKLMEIQTDGTYFMAEVQKMIGSAANNANALRQQRFRDTHRNQPVLPDNNSSVTKSNASVTGCVTEDNESKSKSKSKSKNDIGGDILLFNPYVPADHHHEVPTRGIVNEESRKNTEIFLDVFNSIEGVVPCLKMTPMREIAIDNILRKFSTEEINRTFENLKASEYLTGRVVGKYGTVYHVKFDWFINMDNFLKVFEGNYINSYAEEQSAEPTGIDPERYLNQEGVN